MRRVVSVVCTALAAVAMTGTPASAQTASADMAVEFERATVSFQKTFETRYDTGVGYVQVDVRVHNFGPADTEQGKVIIDLTAPSGTVFRRQDEDYYAKYPVQCPVVVPHTRVRCTVDGSIWLDSYNGGIDGRTYSYYLVLKNKCVSPGRLRIEYPGDPDLSNNSVSLPLKVPGVTAADCGAKPKPSPTRTTAKAHTSPSPSADPSPSSVSPSPSPASPSPTASLAESASASSVAPAPTASDESGSRVGLVSGLLAALAGAGLLAGLRVYARRRRTPDVS